MPTLVEARPELVEPTQRGWKPHQIGPQACQTPPDQVECLLGACRNAPDRNDYNVGVAQHTRLCNVWHWEWELPGDPPLVLRAPPPIDIPGGQPPCRSQRSGRTSCRRTPPISARRLLRTVGAAGAPRPARFLLSVRSGRSGARRRPFRMRPRRRGRQGAQCVCVCV